MEFASPADLSPVPEAEAPRNCPLCPRLVAFREECRAEHPGWWNAPVPAFGDRDAWLAIVGLAPGKQGANRTGRPFTGDFAGELLYATLLKFGLAEENIGESRRWAAAQGRGDPQRGQVPAACEQAGAVGDQDVPSLFRSCARNFAKGPGAGRARPDRSRRGGPSAGRAAVVRPRFRSAHRRWSNTSVELSLLSLQPEHGTAECRMFESVFERAVALKGEGHGG